MYNGDYSHVFLSARVFYFRIYQNISVKFGIGGSIKTESFFCLCRPTITPTL
jgi:hypothetical protein